MYNNFLGLLVSQREKKLPPFHSSRGFITSRHASHVGKETQNRNKFNAVSLFAPLPLLPSLFVSVILDIPSFVPYPRPQSEPTPAFPFYTLDSQVPNAHHISRFSRLRVCLSPRSADGDNIRLGP
jgi:hypothetical protein